MVLEDSSSSITDVSTNIEIVLLDGSFCVAFLRDQAQTRTKACNYRICACNQNLIKDREGEKEQLLFVLVKVANVFKNYNSVLSCSNLNGQVETAFFIFCFC